MGFIAECISVVWKELKWLLLIGTIGFYIGIVGRSDFELSLLVVALPISFGLAFLFGAGLNLVWWAFLVRGEARQRDVTFAVFAKTQEYKDFLNVRAPKIVRGQRKL